MGHMRIPTNVIEARSGERVRPVKENWHTRKHKDGEYLFTLSPFEAAHYISPEHVITDGEYVDPIPLFPRYVMRGIDYAIKRYGFCHVAEQVRSSDGEKVGVIMTLSLGDRVIGVYAVRY